MKIKLLNLFFITVFIFIANVVSAADNENKPNIIVTDISISSATKNVNVTVKNTGATLKYQLSYVIYAKDAETNKMFAKTLTQLEKDEERAFVLDDEWLVNEDTSIVEERSNNTYTIKAWVMVNKGWPAKLEGNSLEKTIKSGEQEEKALEIMNININTDYNNGITAVINWQTNIGSTSTLEVIGRLSDDKRTIIETEKNKIHSVELKNLKPFTKYSYQIIAYAWDIKQATSPGFKSFMTKGNPTAPLPDYIIKDIYFYPRNPVLGEKYSGEIHIVVANNGNSSTTQMKKIYVQEHVVGSSNSLDFQTLDNLRPNEEKDMAFIISGEVFNNSPLNVMGWVDSNALTNGKGDPINDNLFIDESNEDNNTLKKIFNISGGETPEEEIIINSGKDLNVILLNTKITKNVSLQKSTMDKYTNPLLRGIKNITINQKYTINNFIVYGTKSSKSLKISKRADFIKVFLKKFKRLPTSKSDWNWVLKLNIENKDKNINSGDESLKYIGSVKDDDKLAINGANGFAIKGKYLYVTGYKDNGFSIFNINTPEAPKFVKSIFGDDKVLLKNTYSIVVKENFLFLSSLGDNAIQVFNISDPENPIPYSFLKDDEYIGLKGPKGMHVVKNYLYVASAIDNAVEIINISDPKNIKHVKTVYDDEKFKLKSINSITSKGNYLFVSGPADGIQAMDITIPTDPQQSGILFQIDNKAIKGIKSINITGNYLYIASYTDGFIIFDISNIVNPKLVSRVRQKDPGENYSNFKIINNYAVILSESGNFVMLLDISKPLNVKQISKIKLEKEKNSYLKNAYNLEIINDYIYVAGLQDGFGILKMKVKSK